MLFTRKDLTCFALNVLYKCLSILVIYYAHFNIHSPQTRQFCRKMAIKYCILYAIMIATIFTHKGGKTKALVTDL